jgi:hypothetical protein
VRAKRRRIRTLVSILCILPIVGCEKREAAQPSTAPAGNVPAMTEKQVAIRPTSMPATTQSSPSYIWIDQRRYEFPSARIVVKTKDDQLSALMYSDDPPNAIEDKYAGNSFYLEMTGLDLPDTGKLAGAVWNYRAPNSERIDTVSGIFLEGRHQHLQPFDVRVEFRSDVTPIQLLVGGSFLMFDNENDQQPGRLVNVRAELSADIKVRPVANK